MASDSSSNIKTGQGWGTNLLLLLFSFIILVIIEGGLRIAGFGDDLSLLGPSKMNPDYLRVNLGLGKRYFMQRSYGSLGTQDYILKNKTPRVLRVIALGGSTTAGFPYHPGGTFPAILKIFLSQAYPDYRIEMVNLGITAVNSFTVLDLAKDALEYEPDILVVYTGHNELYGALGAASTQKIGGSRSMIRLYMKLRHLRLFQLIRQVIVASKDALTTEEDNDQTLMYRMSENQAIRIGDPQYRTAVENFEANLKELVRIASNHDIPLVLGTLVSNLRDQAPFVSMPTDSGAHSELMGLNARASIFMENGDWAKALELATAAITLDSAYAQSWYLAGQCYLQLGRTVEARNSFIQAQNYDGLRFRASEDLNIIIRELGQSDGSYLADIAQAYAEASPDGIVGNNLMVDHLHPNLDGYFLMAKTFAEAITSKRLLAPGVVPAAPKIDQWYKDAIPVSTLDLKIADFRVSGLTSGWPFQPSTQRQTLSDLKPKNLIEETAIRNLRGDQNYESSHVMLGRYYEQRGELEKALAEYSPLAQVFPANPSSFIKIGQLLVEADRFIDALPYLRAAADLGPDPFSWKWAGIILYDRGNLDAAVRYMSRAVQLFPRDGELMFKLAKAYAETGFIPKARTQIIQLMRLYSDYPGADSLYRELLQSP